MISRVKFYESFSSSDKHKGSPNNLRAIIDFKMVLTVTIFSRLMQLLSI